MAWDCWVHPCTQPFRAARYRASHSAVRIRSGRIRRTRAASAPSSLRQIRKTPLSGRFAYLAERVADCAVSLCLMLAL